jgi:acetyltransferase
VRRSQGAPGQRLAIQPYPSALERTVALRDGRTVAVRPIRPEDEPAIIAMLERSSTEDVRLRFFRPIKEFGHAFAARLTQVDYDREMAFVALDTSCEPGTIAGAARLIADPDGEEAEFAAMVRTDLKGQGFGWVLMQEILEHARRRGIGRVHGEILHENTSMLSMAKEIGFTVAAGPIDSGTVIATIALK